MRHVDKNRPYRNEYIDAIESNKCKFALCGKTWVRFIDWVLKHDGCTRREIVNGVFHGTRQKYYNGYCSSIFSQLLFCDVIDYDKDFKYHITDKGISVLEESHLNELSKLENKLIQRKV